MTTTTTPTAVPTRARGGGCRRNVYLRRATISEVDVRVRWVIGAAICVIGAVWFGQGVGWIGGSFMTGEAAWAVIGAVAFVFGAFMIRGPRRDHGAAPDD